MDLTAIDRNCVHCAFSLLPAAVGQGAAQAQADTRRPVLAFETSATRRSRPREPGWPTPCPCPTVVEGPPDTDVWMTSWDGSRSVRLTTSKSSEHTPRWSPDGEYLAFLSDRDDAREVDQLWLLNRSGGEAERITDLPGGVSDYAWSPDGKRLALIVSDPDPDSATARHRTQLQDARTVRSSSTVSSSRRTRPATSTPGGTISTCSISPAGRPRS